MRRYIQESRWKRRRRCEIAAERVRLSHEGRWCILGWTLPTTVLDGGRWWWGERVSVWAGYFYLTAAECLSL